ncbi:MAG: PAS domain-containing protein, partial [Planctomycetota bacterium]
MCDSKKTKTALIEELQTLRSRAAELERIEAEDKCAEEALRENERFLQDIFDAMQDGISVLDRDLNIVRVNLWMEKRYADRMPLVGKKCYIAYQKRKSVCPWCPSVRAIETGETQTEVIPYPRTDKLIGWVELSAFPLKDADVKVTGVIEHVKDVTDRKQMEEMLRESEQYYRGLVNCSTDVIWRVNLEGILTFVSPSAKALCGFEAEELIGASFEKFLTEDGTRKAREFLERRKRGESGKGAITLDIAHRHKDGTEFLAEIRSAPIFGANGELVGIQGVTRDITERKKAADTLRESEEKFRNLAEHSPNMIFINKRGIVVYSNKKCEEVMGYKREELYSADFDFLTLIGPESVDLVRRNFARHIKGQDVPPIECVLITKKGQRIDTILSTKLIKYEGEVAILGILTDITERKKAEEALRESEERYKALFQGAAEGIVVADNETKEFKYVNPAICKMLGYTEEELKRRGISGVHPKEDLEYVISEFEAQTRGEKRLSSNIPCLRKDGTTVYADINTALVLVDGRQCNVGFFTDITDRRKAEEELLFKSTLLEAQTETSIDGILIVDSEGKSLSFNKN